MSRTAAESGSDYSQAPYNNERSFRPSAGAVVDSLGGAEFPVESERMHSTEHGRFSATGSGSDWHSR
jgi:hypothetical protein